MDYSAEQFGNNSMTYITMCNLCYATSVKSKATEAD